MERFSIQHLSRKGQLYVARSGTNLRVAWYPVPQPSTFPRNRVLAARLACSFAEEPWLAEFIRETFLANFAHDRDISDHAVLASVLEIVGQPESVIDLSQSPDAKTKVRAATERAMSAGIFGAPSFVVGSELFWGQRAPRDRSGVGAPQRLIWTGPNWRVRLRLTTRRLSDSFLVT